MSDAWIARHGAERDRMLAEAVESLSGDERFVAAWLSGSLGRDEDDALSDVDLTVVVAEPHAECLCHRQHQVGAGTTPERLAIFRIVGEPAIVHENHFNAPRGGSFTACVYTSGVVFDWIFVPAATATRPAATRLLFDTVDMPVQPTAFSLTDDQRLHRLSERFAFFWMMVVPMTKVLLRGELVAFHELLDMQYRVTEEVERLLAHRQPHYMRRGRAPFLTTTSEQRNAVVEVCQRMESLEPLVVAAGAVIPEGRLEGTAPWIDALSSMTT